MAQNVPLTAGDYALDFSPGAWKSVGRLSFDAFRAVQEAMERVAEQTARLNLPRKATVDLGNGAHASLSMTVGQVVVLYEIDERAKAIVLRRVIHALREEDLTAGPANDTP